MNRDSILGLLYIVVLLDLEGYNFGSNPVAIDIPTNLVLAKPRQEREIARTALRNHPVV